MAEEYLNVVGERFPGRVFNGLPEWLCKELGSFRPLGKEEFDLEIFRGAKDGFTTDEFGAVSTWAENTLLQALMLQMIFAGRLKIGLAEGCYKLVWSLRREAAGHLQGDTPPPALQE